jgi:hypothetical protein
MLATPVHERCRLMTAVLILAFCSVGHIARAEGAPCKVSLASPLLVPMTERWER